MLGLFSPIHCSLESHEGFVRLFNQISLSICVDGFVHEVESPLAQRNEFFYLFVCDDIFCFLHNYQIYNPTLQSTSESQSITNPLTSPLALPLARNPITTPLPWLGFKSSIKSSLSSPSTTLYPYQYLGSVVPLKTTATIPPLCSSCNASFVLVSLRENVTTYLCFPYI